MDKNGFAALIKRKRGEQGLSQDGLAAKVFGDPARKSDISRIETARVKPQERTIQRLKAALGITDAELDPLRRSSSAVTPPDMPPPLSREDFVVLATHFGIDAPGTLSDADLRHTLTQKAQNYRPHTAQTDSPEDRITPHAFPPSTGDLSRKAHEATQAGDFDTAETLLAQIDANATKTAAAAKLARAQNALQRNRPIDAFHLLCSAADSFASLAPSEPAYRRCDYMQLLYHHGLRYGGPGLALSETMIRQAIATIDKTTYPKLWAKAQTALATVLQEQGARLHGTKGATLLQEAITAYRQALNTPGQQIAAADRATAQNNLSLALQRLGSRINGPDGTILLDDAITAFRQALSHTSQSDTPQQWALAQLNLGNALLARSRRAQGPKRARLLADAVSAYHQALMPPTEKTHPAQWATTQNNLGLALHSQASHADTETSTALLDQAARAYHQALTLRTAKDHPVDWAITQENLARLEETRADLATTTDPQTHLNAALSHIDAALTVFDPRHMPHQHNKATTLRDHLRARLNA